MSDQLSDDDLLNLFKRGTESAFDAIVKRYQDRIYRFTFQMVRDSDEAADLAQETFVKAYRSLHRFRGQSSLYTWLYRIASNTCVNYLRTKKIRKFLRLDHDVGEGGLELADWRVSNPEQVVLEQELLTRIESAIAGLPPRQKSIFVMRHFQELTHAEIAAVVGTSEGSVRAGYFHAVRKLRDALSAEGSSEQTTAHTLSGYPKRSRDSKRPS